METVVGKAGSLLKWWQVWQTHTSCTICKYISLNIKNNVYRFMYLYMTIANNMKLLQHFIFLPCILVVFPAHFTVLLLYQIILAFIWIALQIFIYFCWQIFITFSSLVFATFHLSAYLFFTLSIITCMLPYPIFSVPYLLHFTSSYCIKNCFYC